MFRILVTGSRDWDDWDKVFYALREWHLHARTVGMQSVLVHGGARGLDSIAAEIWANYSSMSAEEYPARWFDNPKARNQHMVNLGADVCLAFAKDWASGTGHCARAARRAGIHTIDYGVSTE